MTLIITQPKILQSFNSGGFLKLHLLCVFVCLFCNFARAFVAEASTSGDESTDDDVLLETAEIVDSATNGVVDQHAVGVLEGRGRQPALGCERHFGNTQHNSIGNSWFSTFGFFDTIVLFGKFN
jgi:hypothetical protein